MQQLDLRYAGHPADSSPTTRAGPSRGCGSASSTSPRSRRSRCGRPAAARRPILLSASTVSSLRNVDRRTGRGTTLEQPPSQPNGSGYNGTLSVGAITARARRWRPAHRSTCASCLGIQQMGAARFCVAAETLPAASSQVFCFIGHDRGDRQATCLELHRHRDSRKRTGHYVRARHSLPVDHYGCRGHRHR